MTNVTGTGKNGKRLWLRSGDNRWIEVPYGAGQDTNVRSVNIWNDKTKKWMTPTWGWTVRNRQNKISNEMNAFDVYLPGRKWIGASTAGGLNPAYNPTYVDKNSQTKFTPQGFNWQRFFHLQDRVDPNWRIVTLAQKIPIHIPNTPVNYTSDEYLYFWPTGGIKQHTHYTDRYNQIPDEDVTRAIMGIERPLFFTKAAYSATDTAWLGQFGRTLYSEEFIAGTLDLKAIRKRLKDKYEFQGTDFVGQYTSIDKMKIKRIYILATIGITHTVYGTAPPDLLAQAHFELYAKIGETELVSGTYTDDGYGWNDGAYTVRSPTGFGPRGTLLYQKSGTDLHQATVTRLPDNDTKNPPRYTRSADLNDTVTFTFDNPGEDNITFYCRLTGPPSLSAPTITGWNTALYFTSNRVTIHYATDGHDTPTSVHNIEAVI